MATYRIEYQVIDPRDGSQLSRDHPYDVYADSANEAVVTFNQKMPMKNDKPALMTKCYRISDQNSDILSIVDVR